MGYGALRKMEEEEKQIIKTIESYREEECVLCLKEKSNILFCKCGHICICKKCKEKYKSKTCPICKKYGGILREVLYIYMYMYMCVCVCVCVCVLNIYISI